MELIDHLSELGYLLGSRISIHDGLVLDVASPRCILQGVEGLSEIALSWGTGCNHDCTRVTSKGILQDSCELRVTVWNMTVL